MAYFNTCPMCGSNLDPGEKCDCAREKQEQRRECQKFYGKFLVPEKSGGQLRLVFDKKWRRVRT